MEGGAVMAAGGNGPVKDVSEAAYSICAPWWGDHCATRADATCLDGGLV